MQVQSIVQQLLEVVCPSMHRVRRASLAASVLGALRGRRLTVTAIGRALPGGTSQKHAIKRADRLLSNRHKMRWCSGGRWFDANRCYQQASSMAKYLGQAILTRSNPLVCQLVVYRGKAQGRKHYTYSGNVAQGRRSRVCAAREREPWFTGHLLAGHPHTGPTGRASVSVAHEHRGRLPGYEKPSVRPGPDLSPLRLGRTLAGIGIHRQSGLAGAVVSGDSHYRTGRPLSIPGQQCAPQTHSLSVVRGLANGPGYPHHPYSGGHEGRLVSTPRAA